MSISAVGGAAASTVDSSYSAAVTRKALDAKEVDGKNALALIASATAPPVKPGHSLSVMA